MSQQRKEFTIALYRPGHYQSDNQLPPELDLPAEPVELLDLLDKARIDDPMLAYKIDIVSLERNYLNPILEAQSLNLFELNHLADKLANIEQHNADVYEVLVKKAGERPTVAQLINLTAAVGGTPIAYGVYNDRTLGERYLENDFIEEFLDLPDNVIKYLDYAKIGKEYREAEHGVFTRKGYSVM